MAKLILCPDQEVSPQITIHDDGFCPGMIWEEGQPININENNLSQLQFICETLPQGYFPDYAVSDMGCSIVSTRMKILMESLGINNIQYFQASVIERKGESPKQGYYAANIIGLLDCIDLDASEMDAEEDNNGKRSIIFSIDKLVLKTNMVEDYTLCRANHFTRLILIEEDLISSFEKAGIKGIKFISPSRWDGINGEI